MNPTTESPEAAQAFLNWVASAEFADLYSNALPGFFSLANVDVSLADPFVSDWNAVLSSLTLAMIPVLILYIIFSRQLIRGITSGAVK